MMPKKKINDVEYIVSACLVGIPCNYQGKSRPDKKALKLFLQGRAIAVCPEVMGGLPTPRTSCETVGGDGADVLAGKAFVKTAKGRDKTKQFIEGAEMALDLANKLGIKKAILQKRSPSCGYGRIYSGKFDKKLVKGDGVLVALLKKKGIKCKSI